MFNKFICMYFWSLPHIYIYIYPDLTRFLAGLCVQLSSSKDWRSYGSSLTPLYIQNICEDIAPLYSTNNFPLQICFSNKHFSSPFPPSKSICLPGYFVHSFDIVQIYYLKLNLTYIYLLKSHNLDLSLKIFHNHSRSSFREIVLFAQNFKENLQLACIIFLFYVIKYKSRNQCIILAS